MSDPILIAAALIEDGAGRLFLVRKRGTSAFMQAGGKIEVAETPRAALARELAEELGFTPEAAEMRYLGRYSADAANEPGRVVTAEMFHIRAPTRSFTLYAELEEAVWASPDEAMKLNLAPLTRDHVLPLARNLAGRGSSETP